MASMLTCEICLEKKTDRKPKSLSCLHSFCRECLSSWVDTRSKGGDIECPVSRQNTRIPPDGIDGLVDDFKVPQLEEMMKAIGDPFVCQACLLNGQTSKALVKCETCNRRLCESCHRFHSNQTVFKSHKIVTEMCEVHGNAVSHVCITCFTEVCVDCILCKLHESHDMCERDEGMGKLRESVADSQRQLKDLRNKIKLRMKTTEIKTGQEIELNIAKLKQAADAMKKEIDRQVTEVIKQYRKQTLQEMKKSVDEFENLNLPKSLDELEQETVTEQNMAKMAELNTELKKVMRQVRDAEERCWGDANKVGNVTTGDGNIYIQCQDRHTVIRIPAGGFTRTTRHITNIPKKEYFTLNPYSNTFLLSSKSGKVFRCSETDMSPEECSLSPGRIRDLPCAGSYRIVVASEDTHTVMVYDEDETLLYTLTGCVDNDHFNHPCDVCLLGHDTLLVADRYKLRVCRFRLSDGSFEGLLLTEEDNVFPWSIAFKYPYLWVTGLSAVSWNWALQLYKWS